MMRIFGIILCMILPVLGWAQQIKPTTEEEYKYGTVGYKIQLNAKLPVKQGYSIKAMPGCEDDDRKVEFQAVYRDGESTPCIVILVYTRFRVPPVYFCIPTADADPALWDKFYKSLTDGTDNPTDQLHFFSMCIGKLMMQFAAQSK